MKAGRRMAMRAPRADERMSRQSAEGFGSAGCRSSIRVANILSLSAGPSAALEALLCRD